MTNLIGIVAGLAPPGPSIPGPPEVAHSVTTSGYFVASLRLEPSAVAERVFEALMVTIKHAGFTGAAGENQFSWRNVASCKIKKPAPF